MQTGVWGKGKYWYWVPWYSRLLCTAWMPQANRSAARTAQVSTGRWISGNFGYSRLNPWLTTEQGLCAANNFTSRPAVQWLSMDIIGECFLHSPTAAQSVLFISFTPVMALTAGRADNMSSSLAFWLRAPWRGVSSLQPYPQKLLCQITEAIWSSSNTLFSCTTSLGRVWKAKPCVCSCIRVTELWTVWSRLSYSVSDLPIQTGVSVLPKGLTRWKEAVGGWSCAGDFDAPPRTFSPGSSQVGTDGNECWMNIEPREVWGNSWWRDANRGQNHRGVLLGKLPHFLLLIHK